MIGPFALSKTQQLTVEMTILKHDLRKLLGKPALLFLQFWRVNINKDKINIYLIFTMMNPIWKNSNLKKTSTYKVHVDK